MNNAMCVQTWGRRMELKELKISVNSIIVEQDFLITRSNFTSLHMMLEAYTKRFSIFDVLYLLCRKTFLSFRFRTFLSSHSKQALTPKIVTLICLGTELKVFLQEIIGKDACAILIVTMESLFYAGTTTVLFPLTLSQSSFLSTTLFSRYLWSSLPLFLFLLFFSPAIFFTSFLPSLACPLQFVLFNIY